MVSLYRKTITIAVRLVNGSDKYQGRIEISLLGSVWGTVCDDGFSTNSAAVVCFMLGFNRSGATFNSAFPDGVASQPILLDDVICSGLETNILACNHTRVASHNCGHSEDVGVVCRP
ncbi:DMBT1-like protein, partial [Mya arenaria]